MLIDRKSGYQWDLMREELIESQRFYVHSCDETVDVVFSPPYGVTSVLRFRELEDYPVLITRTHPVGVPGLSDSNQARVKQWLQLCHRCCVHTLSTFSITEVTSSSKDRRGGQRLLGPLRRAAVATQMAASNFLSILPSGRQPISSRLPNIVSSSL